MATPHPTPTSVLKLAKGKLYGEQRDRAELEPKPQQDIVPRCPSRFSKDERSIWRYYKKILDNFGLFNLAAGPALEKLCVAEAQYRQCAKAVGETGLIIKGPGGVPMRNPYQTILMDQQKIILKYLQELGLSTTSLARMGALAVKARKTKDEIENLLD